MHHSTEKTGSELVVLTGILLLIVIAHTVTAQIDTATATRKKFLKNTVVPAKLFQSKFSLPPFPGPVSAQPMNSFEGNRLFISNPYKENNASKTLLKILGMGALTLFGDRTNHIYYPNKP